MATLTVTTVGRAGAQIDALAVAAASGGDKFPNTGSEFLWIKNASVADITLTIAVVATVDTLAATNRTVTLTAAKSYLIGPFPPAIYNDSDGRVSLTYSGVTTLTLAPFRLGN